MRFATHADIPRIEEICNHPLIRMWTAPEGHPPCEAAKYVTSPSFTILSAHGCLLVEHIDTQRYTLHANLLPSCRGQRAIEAGREAIAMVFAESDAQELFATIPRSIPQSIWFVHQLGFKHLFDKPYAWRSNGFAFDVRVLHLTRAMYYEGEHRKEVCHA